MSAPPIHCHAETYDVLVVGGGVSGSVAAIAAARTGVRVLLVEEHGVPFAAIRERLLQQGAELPAA